MTDLTNLQAVIDDLVTKYEQIVRSALVFRSLSDLRADTDATAALAAGTFAIVLEPQVFLVEVATSGTIHHTAASGTGFRVVGHTVTPAMFDAAGDGVTNDAVPLDTALASGAQVLDLAGATYAYSGDFAPAIPVINGVVIDDQAAQDYRLLVEKRLATTDEALAGEPADKVPRISDIEAIVQNALLSQDPRNIVQTAFTGIGYYPAATEQEIAEYTTSIDTLTDNARIRITATLSLETTHNSVLKITRNSAPLFQNDAASPGLRNIGMLPISYDANNETTMTTVCVDVIDTVGAAGSYEYKFIRAGENGALSVNRTLRDSNAIGEERTSSFVILEEIPV